MDKWDRDIRAINKMAKNYPQEIYAAVAHAAQSEYIFLQRVKKDMGQVFIGMERFLQDNFPSCPFFGK